ncbi:MAG: phosphonopyruvate decarboxylase [Candidatus Aminicenantes bacterium]|nr:phosphonopyruvate decarboxylase [Candidatus Aminicenantes bacterium]
MQNSGLGNAINPLISLVDEDVYSIPVLLLIGWRGEPGKKDEPQHIKQGKVTIDLLDTLRIPHGILPDSIEDAGRTIKIAINTLKRKSSSYALVVRKKTFEPYKLKKKISAKFELSREDAIRFIVDSLEDKAIIVSTTGKTSRELFEYRKELSQSHNKDFLTVGSMGHASQIALSIALSKPSRIVYCLDGDGALIMHMGSLAIIGSKSPKNFKHIVLNNYAHDSVGGQPTAALKINIPAIAKTCGYKIILSAEKRIDLEENINLLKHSNGPALLEIKVKKGARENLGRPTISPKENKKALMHFLQKKEK